ncbi:unnamed protein product [Caenorhabditis auriculariae]|uniref:Uncharacterized protein n=1 Tax=Caenorhabditis auriculariae TaxID=2777116 RepID=A0A8S1HVX7_9PELO|nr:unnamed protein product [Caenorhabditis auriculariae]
MSLNHEDCASPELVEALISTSQRANHVLNFVLTFATVFLTIIAIKVLVYHSIFHNTTRILLFTGLFYANLHEICKSFGRGKTLNRSLTYGNYPCRILISSYDCRYETHVIVGSIAGMVLTECALTLDRVIATFMPNFHSAFVNAAGVVLTVVVGILSVLIPVTVLWNEPYVGDVPQCTQPPVSSFERINFLLQLYTFINVFNLIVNAAIIFVNRRQELSTRYVLAGRYRSYETLITSQAICCICISQFLALGFYSGSVLYLRLIKKEIGLSLFNRFVVWLYVVPYASVSLPLLIVLSVSMVGRHRRSVIKAITHKKETQEQHMRSLKKMWN